MLQESSSQSPWIWCILKCFPLVVWSSSRSYTKVSGLVLKYISHIWISSQKRVFFPQKKLGSFVWKWYLWLCGFLSGSLILLNGPKSQFLASHSFVIMALLYDLRSGIMILLVLFIPLRVSLAISGLLRFHINLEVFPPSISYDGCHCNILRLHWICKFLSINKLS